MDISKLIKPIKLSRDFKAPVKLQYKHLVATILNRADLKEDLAAANSSRKLIHRTRGGSWPEQELSEEFNWLDLAWHEREARDNNSLAYAVRNTEGEYIGCFYLYALGLRQALSNELLAYDVDASWWTTTEAYERGDYHSLYLGLRQWLIGDLGAVGKPWFSNLEIPQLHEFV